MKLLERALNEYRAQEKAMRESESRKAILFASKAMSRCRAVFGESVCFFAEAPDRAVSVSLSETEEIVLVARKGIRVGHNPPWTRVLPGDALSGL